MSPLFFRAERRQPALEHVEIGPLRPLVRRRRLKTTALGCLRRLQKMPQLVRSFLTVRNAPLFSADV